MENASLKQYVFALQLCFCLDWRLGYATGIHPTDSG